MLPTGTTLLVSHHEMLLARDGRSSYIRRLSKSGAAGLPAWQSRIRHSTRCRPTLGKEDHLAEVPEEVLVRGALVVLLRPCVPGLPRDTRGGRRQERAGRGPTARRGHRPLHNPTGRILLHPSVVFRNPHRAEDPPDRSLCMLSEGVRPSPGPEWGLRWNARRPVPGRGSVHSPIPPRPRSPASRVDLTAEWRGQ